MSDDVRVGIGFDAHAFAEGRPLVLAGVRIAHDRGLVGHSDADLICHAVTDALLGASGGDDIGAIFPSDDAGLEGASSIELLRLVWAGLAHDGWEIRNVDAIVIMQEPRLAPHREAMRESLAAGPRDRHCACDGAGIDHRLPRLRRARRGCRVSCRGAAGAAMTVPGVVSFDLDETLWEFLPMMDGALQATLEQLEARRPGLRGAITIEELHRVRAHVAASQQGTFEELRQESFRQVLEAHGETDPDLPAWMVATWMEARLTSVVLHPDVEPALEQLVDAGHVLGAITNGNFPIVRLPLATTFAFIVHAEHVGAFKPAAEPFLHAVQVGGRRSGSVGPCRRRHRDRCSGRPVGGHAGGLDQSKRRDAAARGRTGRRAAVVGGPARGRGASAGGLRSAAWEPGGVGADLDQPVVLE